MLSHLKSVIRSCLPVGFIAIGACGNGSLGDQPTLTGQIEAWNRGGAFTLQASVTGTGTGTGAGATSSVLTSAPIDDTGHFSITLPGSAVLGPSLVQEHHELNQMTPGCTTGLQINPQDFASVSLALRAVSGTTALRVSQMDPAPSTTSAAYFYVDRDVSESGSFTCTFGTTTIQQSIDLRLGTGWNVLAIITSTGGNNVTAGTTPASVKWFAQ